MMVSVEAPVFKGRHLEACIRSVLAQTSDRWRLSLVWDGGDQTSRDILQALQADNHPRIRVWFTENQGIAKARHFLSARTEGDYILPLDDDDELAPEAIERLLDCARQNPWASLIRARRCFIDGVGAPVDQPQWFPFAPRAYQQGMVADVFNQAQPYMIRRSAYQRTEGWRGYAEFMGAGEDCDMFLQLEETGPFALLDAVLYRYRLHGDRASEDLTPAAAFDMWRRLADEALERMGLPLRRTGPLPPFQYEPLARSPLSPEDFLFLGPLGDEAVAALTTLGFQVETTRSPDDPGEAVAKVRASGKAGVCLLGADAVPRDRTAVEAAIARLNAERLDLVAALAAETTPPARADLLLMRREVLLATGGLDPWIPPPLRLADLWLHARRRDFSGGAIVATGLERAVGPAWREEDLAPIRAKWAGLDLLLAEAFGSGRRSTAREQVVQQGLG